MVDLKKLISGFLILAAIASSAALIFLNLPSFGSPGPQANGGASQSANVSASIPANAFAYSPGTTYANSAPSAAYTAQGANHGADAANMAENLTLPPVEPSGNLTNDFAANIARQVLLANPSGPQQTADGQTSLNMPSQEEIMQQLADSPEIKNFKVPDWGAEIKSMALNISGDNSAAAKLQYVNALDKLFKQYFLNPNLISFLYKDASSMGPGDLAPIAETLSSAASGTQAVLAPSSLTDFHKNLLSAIIYEKKFADLGASINETDDPVKTYVIANAQRAKISSVIADLQTELQKSGLEKIISERAEKPSAFIAFLNNLAGIKTAYAQWPTFDFASFGQMLNDIVTNIWHILEEVLILVLRTQLVNTIQTAMVKFVQNSGLPRFITNWLGYQASAFSASVAQDVPLAVAYGDPSFADLVGNTLNLAAKNAFPKSNLSRIVPDVAGFYYDFSKGGWKGFGALLEPQNNFFGYLALANDKIALDAAKAVNAATNQGIAGQGFPGQTQGASSGDCLPYSASYEPDSSCTLGSNCDTDAQNTVTANINYQVSQGYTITQPLTCSNGTCSAQVCKQPSLAQQLITTPGKTIADKLTSALGGDVKLSANANAVAAFLASFINGFINKFTNGGGLLNIK